MVTRTWMSRLVSSLPALVVLSCWGCSGSSTQPTAEGPVATTQEPIEEKAEAERGSAYERALAAAEEAKARIEFETRPDPRVHSPATGWLDLRGDGQKSRFEATFDMAADGWASSRRLTLTSPDKPDPIHLHLDWDNDQAYYPPYAYWSANADDPRYAVEREFLERIKYAYHYISDEDILSQADDPKFAVHLWARDNGMIEEGRMTIRRYKGQPLIWPHPSAGESFTARGYEGGPGEGLSRLEDGPIVYIRKLCGVWGYDRQADEHFLVFHMGRWDGSAWADVTGLNKVDSWLLITTGENWDKRFWRVVAVNVEDYYLKTLDLRPTVWPPNKTIDVTDSTIIISAFRIDEQAHVFCGLLG